MTLHYTVGIDIGGTKINGLLVNSRLSVKKRIKVRTPKTKKEFLRELDGLVAGLLAGASRRSVRAIGCGVPGIMDRARRKTLHVINIPCLNGFPLKRHLEKKFRIPVYLANDALCAGISEYHLLKKKPNSFFVVTLGTGIGAGAIVHGTPVAITEPGHLTVKMDGLMDNCGNRGCLELYAATKFLKREARKRGLSAHAEELAKSSGGRKLIREMGRNLGVGLSDMVKLFNPDMIVFAGGLMAHARIFLPETIREMKKRTFFKLQTKFRVSRNRQNAGGLGAALLYNYKDQL